MKFTFILLLIAILSFSLPKSHAQMNFPKGNTLNLHTHNPVLYLETRILFNTGIYKSTDYRWEKVSDSLDSRWFVSSCFNGDCKNDLLQSGQFIKDFGLNDTSCFLAFHVDCNELNGTSVIKYDVFNTKNMLDFARLTFNISYTNTTGFESLEANKGLDIYPNPAKDCLNILNINNETFDLALYDLQGQLVDTIHSDSHLLNMPLSNSKYSKGIYFVRISNKDKSHFQKVFFE